MAKNKGLQVSSKKRIKQDSDLSPLEILQFIDDFQKVLSGHEGKRKLISLRVPENLLEQFKHKAKRSRVPYQSQIVELMRVWLSQNRA